MKIIMTTTAVLAFAFAAHAQDESKTPAEPSTMEPSEQAKPGATKEMQQPEHKAEQKTEMKVDKLTGAGTSEMGWPASIHVLTLEPGKSVQETASLAQGQRIATLALPGNCLGKNSESFRANHVLYGFVQPANTDVTITVTPKEAKEPLSVYAYTLPTSQFDLPSEASAVSGKCKTSIAAKTSMGRTMEGKERSVRFDGKSEPHNVIIGVSSADATNVGDFIIQVKSKKE